MPVIYFNFFIYGYVEQNSLSFVDPTGEAIPAIVAVCASNPVCAAAVSTGVGALSGAAIDLVLQLFSNSGNLQCVDKTDVAVSALTSAIPLGIVGTIGNKVLEQILIKGVTNPVPRTLARAYLGVLTPKA